MDIFDQKKFLIKVIVGLIILNLTIISFILVNNVFHNGPSLFPKNEEYKDVSGILKKELKLTDTQVEKFQAIRESYFKKEVLLKEIIRNEKDSMNTEMFHKNTNDKTVKLLAKKISDNEYKMEMIRYDQAKEMKAICTSDQQEQLHNLVREIRDYFRPDNQPTRK